MKRVKKLLFPLIILSYSLLYIATKKNVPCTDYCNKLYRLDTLLTKNRSYVWFIGSCISGKAPNDTLCVLAGIAPGVDWNLLADTICQYTTQVGLMGQTILIMRTGSPPDTLAKRQCP